MKMVATTAISGVHEVTEFESDIEIMSQDDFFESLATLEDNKIIGCDANAEYVTMIDNDYGVQFIE